MIQMKARARVRIWGSRNAWSLAAFKGAGVRWKDCDISVEIQGDTRNGYNLIMAPTGFPAADQWYKTKKEALAEATELFGLSAEAWSAK